MIVVADSSPINILVRLHQIELLPTLFSRIVIPPQVAAELTAEDTPIIVRLFMSQPPDWLEVRTPTNSEQIGTLDPGESAAINLACELKAEFLLIDDLRGRREALARKLLIMGTVGILETAAKRKLIDLSAAFEKLKQTDFFVSPEILDQVLARYRDA